MRLFLVVLVSFCSLIVFAQRKPNIDSLERCLIGKSELVQLPTLIKLSKILVDVDNYKSVDLGKKALLIAQKEKKKFHIVLAYSNIGDAYYALNRYDDALQYYQQSMSMASHIGVDSLLANAYNNLGICHYQMSELENAQGYFTRSKKLCEQIGDDEGLANSLNNLGNIYMSIGNYNEASKYYEQTLSIKKKNGNLRDYANGLNNMGNVFESQGEYNLAIRYYEKALDVVKMLNDKETTADSYASIGLIYQNRGNNLKALSYYHAALLNYQAIKNQLGIARIFNSIGSVYYHSGKHQNALEYYQRALKIQERCKNKAGIAVTLYNMGSISDALKDYKKALEYYQNALKIKQEIGEQEGIANVYTSIGNAYGELKQNAQNKDTANKYYQNAISYYQKALDIKQTTTDKAGIAMLYHNIGALLEMNGEDQDAITYYLKSLSIEQELDNNFGIAQSLQNIGTIYKNKGNFVNALDYYKRCETIAVQQKFNKILMVNYKYLSEVFMNRGNSAKALDYYIAYSVLKDSIFNEESMRQISEVQTKYESEKKQQQIALLQKNTALKEAELTKRRIWIYMLVLGMTIIGVFLFLLYNRYMVKTKANEMLEHQNKIIEEHRKSILDSIQYARSIQQALLTPRSYFKTHLTDYFVLYKPRDIVSGDFYWASSSDDVCYVAVADCTGHGVPGAFMSMLGISMLNEIMSRDSALPPDEILNRLRQQVIDSLHQTTDVNVVKDGMDIALFSLNKTTNELQFSGAQNPLYIIRDKQLIELSGDSMPISIYINIHPFTIQNVQLQKGDMLYLFSDGYVDQFGGEKGKKFMTKRFKALLIEISHLTMEQQQQELDLAIENWKGTRDQIDDILVLGIQV